MTRPTLTTSNLDEAAAVIGALYAPVTIEADRGRTLEVRLEALRLNNMTAGLLTCSEDARVITSVPEHFHVNLPLNGSVASRAGLDPPVVSTPKQAMVFMPGKPASISWTEGTTQLCLMITRTSIESALEQLLGGPLSQSVQFDPVLDLATRGGSAVRTAFDLLLRDFENGIPVDMYPRVGRHIEGLLVDHLLLGQPHNFSEELLRPTTVSPSLAIDRAIQLLEASPAEAWSTVSLAGAVHLSVRALQRGFERKTGVPPMRYLQRLRLRSAHDELERSTPETASVTGIASRWGFVHMGRFAIAYRQKYGVSPSATLRGPAHPMPEARD